MAPDSSSRPPFLIGEWDAARAPLEFLWEEHPKVLAEILGREVLLAPLPDTAIERVQVVAHRFAGELPAERPEAKYPARF